MDYRLTWTVTAFSDLRELVRYIARDDRRVAERFGSRIVSKVSDLASFPRIGRIVPEYQMDSIRQVLVPPYRIVYKIDDEAFLISIIRVWHGARGDLCETGPDL